LQKTFMFKKATPSGGHALKVRLRSVRFPLYTCGRFLLGPLSHSV